MNEDTITDHDIDSLYDNLNREAESELTKACGHELWRTLGFDAFDGLDDASRRATANYYYGQWQTVRELQDALG